MMGVTQRLGGTNYVLWGGREGYETLLNTDLGREGRQFARFLHLVAEHKHKIGFNGTLLIEPKPMEPTKHQYDYDTATVHGFLVRNGLEDEYRVNIEANHATLAGHSFHHEVAYAVANGLLGSIDANRGDYQNGWDTDQFPNSVEELSLAVYEILRGGGFTTGGFNFDAKLRRQSMARDDLFHAHIGGIDTLARSLLVAAEMLEAGRLESLREARYAGWDGALGTEILGGSLESLATRRSSGRDRPATRLRSPGAAESIVNQHIWAVDGAGRCRPAAPRRRLTRGPMAFVIGIDASTTATKAVLIDEAGVVRGIGVSDTGMTCPPRSGASRTRPLVGRRRGRHPRRPGADRDTGRCGRRGGAHRPDARPRPPGRERRGPAAGHPLERSADGRRVRPHPGGRRPGAPDRCDRQ